MAAYPGVKAEHQCHVAGQSPWPGSVAVGRLRLGVHTDQTRGQTEDSVPVSEVTMSEPGHRSISGGPGCVGVEKYATQACDLVRRSGRWRCLPARFNGHLIRVNGTLSRALTRVKIPAAENKVGGRVSA